MDGLCRNETGKNGTKMVNTGGGSGGVQGGRDYTSSADRPKDAAVLSAGDRTKDWLTCRWQARWQGWRGLAVLDASIICDFQWPGAGSLNIRV